MACFADAHVIFFLRAAKSTRLILEEHATSRSQEKTKQVEITRFAFFFFNFKIPYNKLFFKPSVSIRRDSVIQQTQSRILK